MGNELSCLNRMGRLTQHCGLPPPEKLGDDSLKTIAEVPVFKGLPPEAMVSIARIATRETFKSGDAVITQGEVGDAFFVIVNGEASVCIDGDQVGLLKKHSYFGERALVMEDKRSATIRATTEVTCLKIMAAQFQSLNLRSRLNFGQRAAVGVGGGTAHIQVQPPSPKTPEQRKVMLKALQSNRLLNQLLPLGDNHANQMIDLAWRENVPAGKNIITEGDIQADYFYIVQEGTFVVKVGGSSQSLSLNNMMQAGGRREIGKGGSFGELALLYSAPRTASVTASVDSVVWVIDRKNFQDILAKSADDIAKEHVVHLDKVSVFDGYSREQKEQMSMALNEMIFSRDETIFLQGEDGDAFYILIEGEVGVIFDGVESHRLTATENKAEVFGEKALLESTPRTATIMVVSEQAKALTLDRASFNMLLGNRLTTNMPSAAGGPKKEFGLIHLKDLSSLGLLGCGGFGAVHLVEHNNTKDIYALKMISKGYIVKGRMQENTIREKDIQLMCNSPFVIQLIETFASGQTLYFLMELAIGGELYAIYNRRRMHGKQECAKFYIAGVVCAFEHLHSLKILYRDLKPENLLLTATGRIKLTDMGLAKVVVGKTRSSCGTPDYFAPEMVDPYLHGGHNSAVDWWTVGILTYELMTGMPPFTAQTPEMIFAKVKRGIDAVDFPGVAKGGAEALVKDLCHAHPAKRLPMKAGGIQNVKDHAWFEGFDWKAMLDLTLKPPYNPNVSDPAAALNDFSCNTRPPPSFEYTDDGTGWDRDFATSS